MADEPGKPSSIFSKDVALAIIGLLSLTVSTAGVIFSRSADKRAGWAEENALDAKVHSEKAAATGKEAVEQSEKNGRRIGDIQKEVGEVKKSMRPSIYSAPQPDKPIKE